MTPVPEFDRGKGVLWLEPGRAGVWRQLVPGNGPSLATGGQLVADAVLNHHLAIDLEEGSETEIPLLQQLRDGEPLGRDAGHEGVHQGELIELIDRVSHDDTSWLGRSLRRKIRVVRSQVRQKRSRI